MIHKINILQNVILDKAICLFFDPAQNDKLLNIQSQAELCRSLITFLSLKQNVFLKEDSLAIQYNIKNCIKTKNIFI